MNLTISRIIKSKADIALDTVLTRKILLKPSLQQTDEQHLSTTYAAEMYSSAAQVVFDVHCVVVQCPFDLA